MKSLSFVAMSVLTVSCLSGCCCPGLQAPWGGGVWGGQCGTQPHGAMYGAGSGPTAFYQTEGIQTATPIVGQPIAMPMMPYPSVALESLPTYR